MTTTTFQFSPISAPPETARLGAVKGWHDDPRGHHHLRYHDGNGWTEHVTHFGPVPCTSCR